MNRHRAWKNHLYRLLLQPCSGFYHGHFLAREGLHQRRHGFPLTDSAQYSYLRQMDFRFARQMLVCHRLHLGLEIGILRLFFFVELILLPSWPQVGQESGDVDARHREVRPHGLRGQNY